RHTRCLSDWSSDVCSSDLTSGASSWRGPSWAPCPLSSSTSSSWTITSPALRPALSSSRLRFHQHLKNNVAPCHSGNPGNGTQSRSEEHTSELQSLRHLVCR